VSHKLDDQPSPRAAENPNGRLPFNSLDHIEELDWSDEPVTAASLNRHLAQIFILGE